MTFEIFYHFQREKVSEENNDVYRSRERVGTL
jgi:hypothetical protein